MINIQDIIPFMKEGWVAMDSNGSWYCYDKKPKPMNHAWACGDEWIKTGILSEFFDIAPADDWTKSLIRVKGVKTR